MGSIFICGKINKKLIFPLLSFIFSSIASIVNIAFYYIEHKNSKNHKNEKEELPEDLSNSRSLTQKSILIYNDKVQETSVNVFKLIFPGVFLTLFHFLETISDSISENSDKIQLNFSILNQITFFLISIKVEGLNHINIKYLVL